MKRFLLIPFLTLLLGTLIAQGVEFDFTEHRYGLILEETGPSEVVFPFKNLSDSPVRIRDVIATCGCTSSGWSAGSIPPGESGEVRISYDPDDRPGDFRKNARVVFAENIPDVELSIDGTVIPDPNKFRKTIGHLLIKENTITIPYSPHTLYISECFRMKNCCGDTLRLSLRDSLKHAIVRFIPEVLGSGESGWMRVDIDTSRLSEDIRESIWVSVESRSMNIFGAVALKVEKRSTAVTDLIDVTPEEALKIIESGREVFVLDVRTPEEFESGHLPNAVNIDILDSGFSDRFARTIHGGCCLVYCKSGVRSAKALEALRDMGLACIYHMHAGYTGWEKAGYKSEE